MSDKWERPALPQHGDAEDLIYAGIGRVVCAWEEIEVALSHLYTCVVGMRFEAEAMYEYDERRKLYDEACKYFLDQDKERELKSLIDECEGAKKRRNDVAHGLARPLSWWLNIADGDQRWLVPSPYNRDKASMNNLPIYAYNHALLVELADNLINLALRITGYRNEKFPAVFQWIPYQG